MAEGAADRPRDFRGVDDRAGSAERVAVYLSVLPGLGYGLWAKGTPTTKAAEGGCYSHEKPEHGDHWAGGIYRRPAVLYFLQCH